MSPAGRPVYGMEVTVKTAIIYDCSCPAAARTAQELTKRGWHVIEKKRGEEASCALCPEADLLVVGVCAEYEEKDRAAMDYDSLCAFVTERIYGVHTVLEASIPALRAGKGKRIAILTRACSGISGCTDKGNYAEHMLLAGINMKASLIYNRLRPDGFTMRCYALPDEAEAGEGGISPVDYICMNFCFEEGEPYKHSEENRFVLRDGRFREIGW